MPSGRLSLAACRAFTGALLGACFLAIPLAVTAAIGPSRGVVAGWIFAALSAAVFTIHGFLEARRIARLRLRISKVRRAVLANDQLLLLTDCGAAVIADEYDTPLPRIAAAHHAETARDFVDAAGGRAFVLERKPPRTDVALLIFSVPLLAIGGFTLWAATPVATAVAMIALYTTFATLVLREFRKQAALVHAVVATPEFIASFGAGPWIAHTADVVAVHRVEGGRLAVEFRDGSRRTLHVTPDESALQTALGLAR